MSVQPVQPVTATDPYDPTTAPAPAPQPAGDSVSVSGPGKLLSRLQDLEQTNPARARELLTDLASRMRSAAAKGGDRASQLSAMADKLQHAADTGDLSGLQPAQTGHRHHHGRHPHHAQQSYGQNSGNGDPLSGL